MSMLHDPYGDRINIEHFEKIDNRGSDHEHRLDEQVRINNTIMSRVKNIEEHLFILDRNRNYEKQYPELQAAYNEYNRILEKYKVFNILKDEE